MTLCVAWVRQVGDIRELVLASDSRLSGGGEKWDSCPKILELPRSDSAICFAGSTLRTYPLMLQLTASVNSFPESRKRVNDFSALHGHTVRIFNDMLKRVHHEVPGGEESFEDELANTRFLMVGYSWKRSCFRIIRITYDTALKRYVSHNFRTHRQRTCVFIGDTGAGVDIPNDAKNALNQLLYGRDKLPHGNLDWEPFEVLRNIIGQGQYDTVGGAPQLLKIYRHMNSQHFGVYWPSKAQGKLTIVGRETLEYERTDWPRFDAETLEVSGISFSDEPR